MKKFKCTVTRTDEYIIELDEAVLDENWMSNFRTYMYDYHRLEEHAEHLAQVQARIGEHSFIEGYGDVNRNGGLIFDHQDYDTEGNLLPEDQRRQAAKGINIKIVSEDEDCEVEVEEVKE